jgi:hypothetical protein
VVVSLDTDESKFYLSVQNFLDDSCRITDSQNRLHIRILLNEGSEFSRENILPRYIAAAYQEFSFDLPLKPVHGGKGFPLQDQYGLGALQKNLAQRGGSHFSANSVKDL